MEAIADAKHQAFSVIKKVSDGILDRFVPEEGSDEFGGTVWFIATAESAWDEDDLALLHLFSEIHDGFVEVFGIEVIDDEDLNRSPCIPHGLSGIEFAVGSWEDWDKDSHFVIVLGSVSLGFSLVGEGFIDLVIFLFEGWVDTFELAFV